VQQTHQRLLDGIAKKRWGNDPAYAAYYARTPVLFPLLSRFI
jgi:hypothetical protein